MTEYDDVRSDIIDIVKLSQNYDFNNKKHVSLILRYMKDKDMMNSMFGARFRKRLNDLVTDTTCDEKCVLCNNFDATDHILCEDCKRKLIACLDGVAKCQ